MKLNCVLYMRSGSKIEEEIIADSTNKELIESINQSLNEIKSSLGQDIIGKVTFGHTTFDYSQLEAITINWSTQGTQDSQ